jgi:hypothetical protein
MVGEERSLIDEISPILLGKQRCAVRACHRRTCMDVR